MYTTAVVEASVRTRTLGRIAASAPATATPAAAAPAAAAPGTAMSGFGVAVRDARVGKGALRAWSPPV